MKKVLYLSILLSSCTTTEDVKKKSEWVELDGVGSVNCAYWPMQKTDLGMNSLIALQGSSTHGLVASMRMRNNSSSHYYVPFDGKVKLDPDDIIKLNLGRGAVVLGGTKVANKTLLVVIQHKSTRAILELRDPQSNEVIATIDNLPGQASTGSIHNVEGGFWLVLKHHEQRSSVMYVGVRSEARGDTTSPKDRVSLSATRFDGLKLRSQPEVLTSPGVPGAIVVIYDTTAAGKGKKEGFFVSKLDAKGGFSPPVALPVKIELEVESFAATAHAGKYFLGFIDGDSMIGQAKMKIASFSWDVALTINGEDSAVLGDAHVSDPVWISSGSDLFVGALKWVDEESTLATYKVDGSTLGSSRSLGVFSKGSKITGMFVSKDNRNFFGLRHRENDVWKFRLCAIKNLIK